MCRTTRSASFTSPTGAPGNEVRNQVLAILALRQFVGLPRLAVADFFDAQLP